MSLVDSSKFGARAARLGLVFTAGFFVAACSKVTETNLERIHDGMTRDQVKTILGAPKVVIEKRNDYLTYTGASSGPEWEAWKAGHAKAPSKTIYYYRSSFSQIEIDFERDAVVAKKETHA